MTPKTVLITGSTDGIGKVTAKVLAKMGYTVILHGRNKVKAEKVCKEIASETGNNSIDFVLADLFLLSDVKRMATEFKTKYKTLDVLINNAGAMFGSKRETTAEGFEKTIALNVLTPFLLTELLLDVLSASPSARIINVTSAAHSMSGKPDLNDLQLERNYTFGRAYGQAKLFLIWLTQRLATKLEKQGIKNITVNSIHPGMIKTEFGKNADKGFLINLLLKLSSSFAKTPEQGAETVVHLATSKTVENITGKYFSALKMVKPTTKYYSPENELAVWDYCMRIASPYLI